MKCDVPLYTQLTVVFPARQMVIVLPTTLVYLEDPGWITQS